MQRDDGFGLVAVPKFFAGLKTLCFQSNYGITLVRNYICDEGVIGKISIQSGPSRPRGPFEGLGHDDHIARTSLFPQVLYGPSEGHFQQVLLGLPFAHSNPQS